MIRTMKIVNRKLVLLASFVSILFLASCKPDKGKPPIGKHKMVLILTDVHIAQSLNYRQTTIPADKLEKNRYYKSVLDKHNVSEALFDSAVAWYSRNTGDYKQVYIEVLDSLNHRRIRM